MPQAMYATQVCCPQSPWPCGRPLLTWASAGDTHTLKGRQDPLDWERPVYLPCRLATCRHWLLLIPLMMTNHHHDRDHHTGLAWWLRGKESACRCRRHWALSLDPASGRSPGGGNDNPCSREPRGQRIPAGYSPRSPKGLETATEHAFFPAGFLLATESLWKSRTSQVALMMALSTCKPPDRSFQKAQAAS